MSKTKSEVMPVWFYLNGRFVEDADATIPVTDHSFLYGDGCFEGVSVVEGKILYLDEHVERLFRSARMLRIAIPLTPGEMREVVVETAARNRMDREQTAYLRPLVTRGAGPLGVKNTSLVGAPSVVVIPQIGRQGGYQGEAPTVSAVISRYVRSGSDSLDPGIKSNNYLTSILALLDAEQADPDVGVVILRDSRGFLAEGHAMNLFAVWDTSVVTPPATRALRGITRGHVIATIRGLGLEVEQRDLSDYDLICADEAFVTSSMSGVTAISSVDGRPMPSPVPGRTTTAIRTAYVSAALSSGTPISPR